MIMNNGTKTLIVYIKDSHYKFYDLFNERVYTVEDGDIIVYRINEITGEESIVARFKTWDYFIIE